ncbi:ABC transporter permease, partial [Streptococcus pyogenes]
LKSDTPLLLAIVMIGTLFVFAGNLIADILNSIINPQIRRKV